MKTFDEDFAWQRPFREHYEEIALGVVRVSVASWDDDARRNTDFQIATLGNGHRIACRARRGEYAARYHSDFTIRYSRPSGVETEWHKLRAGLGDYIIYGFAGDAPGRLARWVLINAHLVREYLDDGGRWTLHENDDGTQFAALALDQLPIGAVINTDGQFTGRYLGPPVGPCDVCGGLVFNIGTVNGIWTHPCCLGPIRCVCLGGGRNRFGWDARSLHHVG